MEDFFFLMTVPLDLSSRTVSSTWEALDVSDVTSALVTTCCVVVDDDTDTDEVDVEVDDDAGAASVVVVVPGSTSGVTVSSVPFSSRSPPPPVVAAAVVAGDPCTSFLVCFPLLSVRSCDAPWISLGTAGTSTSANSKVSRNAVLLNFVNAGNTVFLSSGTPFSQALPPSLA